MRRLLPPGDDGGGVCPAHPPGDADAGGEGKGASPGNDRGDGGGGGGPAIRAGGGPPGPDQRHQRPFQKADGHCRALRRHGHLGPLPGGWKVLLRRAPHGGGEPGGPGDGALHRPHGGGAGGDALRPDGPVLPAQGHFAP